MPTKRKARGPKPRCLPQVEALTLAQLEEAAARLSPRNAALLAEIRPPRFQIPPRHVGAPRLADPPLPLNAHVPIIHHLAELWAKRARAAYVPTNRNAKRPTLNALRAEFLAGHGICKTLLPRNRGLKPPSGATVMRWRRWTRRDHDAIDEAILCTLSAGADSDDTQTVTIHLF